MKRRDALVALSGALVLPASAQLLQPFSLRLVRRTGWQQLMFKNQCVIGDLYMTTSAFPIADPGTKLANALELTYRNNLKNISSIPEGEYPGSVRTDGPRGWRIELQGTGDRKNVQVHIGNRPDNTIGCILLGTGDSTDSNCSIGGSAAAMQKLKDAYADATNKRPIVLRIQS